jgi:hypothetical protein
MNISNLSALDLQTEIDRVAYYAEDGGPELMNALKEVERLRGVCRDIIDLVNVQGQRCRDRGIAENYDALLEKIEASAQAYYSG